MFLRRFYDEELAQASYMVGCTASGSALVVDPARDVEPYMAAAAAEGVRITHVTETHIHADFVSGSRELARHSGAQLLLSDEGGPDWRYAFADEAGARLLRDGDRFGVGNVRVEVVHTPGHTPEHLTFLITDGASADEPMGALTGDFIFVGDVGRPDLLERAAHIAGTMESSARRLFASLRRFASRPDWLQIWPGHGAGSACGKALGAVPQTTLGYEKRFNWAFGIADEDEFVRAVLAGQPEPPRYFAQMKRINRDGAPHLAARPRPERLPASRLAAFLARGAVVVDTRHAADFAESHIPGTLNIPLDRSFTTWAGALLPYDRDIVPLVDEEAEARGLHAVRSLERIGLDRVPGWVGADALDAWRAEGRPLGGVGQVDAATLAARMSEGAVHVIDVRARTEWDAGHMPGARHIPLGELADRLGEIPRDRPVVLQCQTGGRSAIAASVLLSHGIAPVANLVGGYVAWSRNAPASTPA